LVARSGYKRAFINSPGVWRKDDDPFLIPRINLSEGTVTDPNGKFSPLAFEYRVFWNALVHGKRRFGFGESTDLFHWLKDLTRCSGTG